MYRRTALILSLGLLIALLAFGFLAGSGQTSEASGTAAAPSAKGSQTYHIERVTTDYHHDLSPAVRDLPAAPTEMYTGSKFTDQPEGGPLSNASTGKANGFTGDSVAQTILGPLAIPTPLVAFDGLSNISGVNPPDPDGDVGPNHYVHMTNLSFAIYTKAGAIIGTPHLNNTLWAGFGGPCQTSNSGDPIVLHDQLADRWILTQFTSAGPTYYQCVAVSQTADPTGAYWRYGFNMGNQFGDYPKYAVWPDAYYLSERDFTGGATQNGQGLHALERAQMLTGGTAQDILIRVPFTTPYLPGDGLLVADIDGSTLPPAGEPAFVVGSQDNGGPYGAPSDALNLWKFHADFVTPANSTLTGPTVIPVAAFDSIFDPCGGTRACIPQPTTTFKIDILSYRQRVTQRLSYRNMGTYEMLLTGQSVEGAPGIAGMRWYELRDPNGTPTLYQQGTYVPGVTDSIHRWMGSLAMDASGNIALGYSASAATGTFPSSAYTGRLAGDPLGTMPQGEGFFKVGTGSETGGGNRWGDYTAMHVDPTDDCTFWYVSEYIPTTSASGWRGHIGAFKFPGCTAGGATPTPTTGVPTSTNTPVGPTATNTVAATPTCVAGGGAWTAGADLPSTLTRAYGAYFPANGKFYTLGGRTGDGDPTLAQLQPLEYTPGSNTWVQKTAVFSDVQTSNVTGGVLTASGTPVIMVVGGSAGGGTGGTTETRMYNPVADTMTTVATDPWLPGTTTVPGGSAVYNNKLYVFGGFVINVGMSNEIWEYDPARAAGTRWALKTAVLPTALGYIPAATVGNFIYTIGGSEWDGSTLVDSAVAYKYDPVADTITAIASTPRATGETRALNYGGKVWVFGGGRVAPNPGNQVEIYDPATDTYTAGPSFTTPRRNFPIDTDGTKIYLAGGYDDSGTTLLATMEIFTPGGSCGSPTVVATNTSIPSATSTQPAGTSTTTVVATSTAVATSSTTAVASPTACALMFTDVPVGSTFYDNIRCLACRGIINGYSSGCETGNPCFRPGNLVTRGQLSKIVSNSAGFTDPATTQQYEDVPVGSTFHEFIYRLTIRSYVNGYPCGGVGEPCVAPGNLPYFRPNANVTRGQLSKIVSNGAGFSEPAGAQQFQDVAPGSTFYDFIWRLTNRGVMTGYPCGGVGEPCVAPGNLPYFRPGANATRGQASKIVANTFFPGCETPRN